MDGNFDPSNPSRRPSSMNYLNGLEMHFPASEYQQYFLTNSSVQSILVEHEMHLPASVTQQHTSVGANSGFNISSREPSLSTEGNSSLRGSLCQRIARAGFSAPTINTGQINSANMASTMDIQSSNLTISPGHTPSALFDSPRLVSNALIQLSPTTGIISLPYYDRSSLSILTLDSTTVENCKEECLEDIIPGGVSFQPQPDTTPSYRPSMENKVSSPTDNNEESIQNDINELSCTKDPVNDISQNSSHLETKYDGENDGFKWRKYGQKPVKGSEYPRSYYKCTHPGCPVTKKVERSHEGYIIQIIYIGTHNHETPVKKCRSGIPPYQQSYNRIDASTMHGESSLVEFGEDSNYVQNQDAVNISSSNSNDELEDGETHASIGNEGDGEGDDNESNRSSLDACAVEMNIGARGAREPRVVVQTVSEVDILDDGYRWRKYGQKVVKGNPNPRSYYKCTSAGCRVRKHIERASNDLTSVITAYEGKHNHEVPPARSSTNHSTTAYQSHNLNRRYPQLPQSPLMNINPPSFLNNLNLPNLDYGVRPMPRCDIDMNSIGVGVRDGSMGQMGHQIRHPVFDSNIGTDGLMLPKEEDQTPMDPYDQLMTPLAPLEPPM